MATKVSLESIRSLTFYNDEYTQARRTNPIPQLRCVGKPCKQYQPEVIRCLNDGGKGLDVQWKCEADLPEKLRFGKVEVSCEGWSRPGDTNVLKGSCALEYRLVYVPDAFSSTTQGSWFERMFPRDIYETIFMTIWGIAFLFFIYVGFKSFCVNRNLSPRSRRPDSADDGRGGSGRGGGGGGGGSGGNRNEWFPHNNAPDHQTPPPPYSDPRNAKTFGEGSSTLNWRPGFWTGAGLGAAVASLWNPTRARERSYTVPLRPSSSIWDWDRPGGWVGGEPSNRDSSFGAFDTPQTAIPRRNWSSEDRGEGPSNLGRTRAATAHGGTKTR